MTENYAERIENALNDIQKIQLLFRQRYGEECLADKEIGEVLKIAKAEREEIQQYRAIGTVEECREAREKQRGKKPNITIGETEEDKLACCPICEGNLDWTYNGFWRKGNQKYCSNCGQAISWEGEE